MVVAVEVEVIYLFIDSDKGHLMVGCLQRRPADRHNTLQGLLHPDERPEECARRLLADVVEPVQVLHPPEFVRARRNGDRQVERPTLTLSYVVLGRPTRATAPFTEYFDLDDRNSFVEHMVNHSTAVTAARNVAIRLLETTPLALRLLDPPDEPFTLDQLWEIYRCVRGRKPRDDRSNFRRKVEGAKDFVVEYTGPRPAHTVRRGSGKPAKLYIAGNATTLDPPIRFER